MASTIYTGSFEQTQNTYLRLTADPYRIITSVTKDGTTISPLAGTTAAPTNADCLNYTAGILYGNYNLGKLITAASTVTVITTAYSFNVTYHYYRGPSTQQTTTQTQYYNQAFTLASTLSVNNYRFDGWAVGSQNSSIIIPSGRTQAVLTELDNATSSPSELKVPTLYTTPSTTLHLYALWRPCASVTINVTVGDGSPLITQIG